MHTADTIKARIEEAATTFRHWLANEPEPGPKAYGSNWPEIIRQAIEAYGYDDARVKLPVPSGPAIARMDEVFGWFDWLDREDQKLVWWRANGMAWWKFAQRYGRSESWVRRRHRETLKFIAFQANEKIVAL